MARETRPRLTCAMPQLTNRQMPTGGVSMPMARFTTTRTPKCTGSTAICGVSSASTGTTSSSAAVVSITQPMTSSSSITSSSRPTGGSASELTKVLSNCALCCIASSQPKTLAIAMMKRMPPAVTCERMMSCGSSLHFSSLLITVPTSSA